MIKRSMLKDLLDRYTATKSPFRTIWGDEAAILELKHFYNSIYVAGVNICACVSSTVEELSRDGKDSFLIEVSESCSSCACNSSEEACKEYSISKLEFFRGVISSKGKNDLKSALEQSDFQTAYKILADYQAKIPTYMQAENIDVLKEIKRDLHSSLYFLKFLNPAGSNDRTLELCKTLNQLLDTIQTTLDTENSKRCVIM